MNILCVCVCGNVGTALDEFTLSLFVDYRQAATASTLHFKPQSCSSSLSHCHYHQHRHRCSTRKFANSINEIIQLKSDYRRIIEIEQCFVLRINADSTEYTSYLLLTFVFGSTCTNTWAHTLFLGFIHSSKHQPTCNYLQSASRFASGENVFRCFNAHSRFSRWYQHLFDSTIYVN